MFYPIQPTCTFYLLLAVPFLLYSRVAQSALRQTVNIANYNIETLVFPVVGVVCGLLTSDANYL